MRALDLLSKITPFLFLICTFQTNVSFSQCTSNVTLTSQEDVDKFDCATVGGNLIISGADIVDLDPLFTGTALTTVTGSVVVDNCPILTNLTGLDGITSIGGNFQISNCASLISFGSFGFQLQTIGSFFIFNNLPNLDNITQLGFLTTVGSSITFQNACGITDFNGFNNLTSCPIVQFSETDLGSINGFNGLGEVGYLNINNNSKLVSVSGFSNLTKIVPTSVNGNVWEWLQIANNTALTNYTAHPNLTSVPRVNFIGNSNLSDCCFILDVIINQPIQLIVGGNGGGCGSAAEINAPPTLTACPSNQTLPTSDGVCFSSFNLTNPIGADNCDFLSLTAIITNGDGSNITNGPVSGGATTNYALVPGTSTFEFTATDMTGKTTSCTTTITVNDTGFPEFTEELPTDLTIFTAAGSCEATHNVTFPQGSDNCAIASTELAAFVEGMSPVYVNFSPVIGQTYNIDLAPGTYVVEASIRDANGFADLTRTNLTVIDNVQPTISGIPSDVTISCDDSFPSIPNPGVSDNCDSNPSISVTSSLAMGECELGAAAEIHEYRWTAEDNAGNMQEAEWKVTVISDFSFDLGEDIILCDESFYTIDPGNIGMTYEWSNGNSNQTNTITNSGTYSVTITSNNGCCYADELVVTFDSSPNAEATGGTLSCTAGNVLIEGSSSTAGVSYSWTGPGGFTSNDQNPSVESIGTYTLTVSTVNGCTATATAVVEADTDVPDASATGGIINCSITSTTIMGESATAGVTFTWSGPDGFSSTMQNPQVNNAGIYSLLVTASNGCTSIATAEVIADIMGPELDIEADNIDCNSPSSQAMVSSDQNIVSYSWTGPDGFSSIESTPQLEAVGTYTLIATGENGCTNSQQITITGDFTEPQLSTIGGILSCTANAVQIEASSSDQGITYSWTGPDNFSSNLQSPEVSQPGTYTVTATGTNGCSSSADAIVESDNDLPDVSATGGTIDCNNSSVILVGSTTTENATISWNGPNGFSTDNPMPEAFFPGLYTFTVTTSGGCSAFKTVEVIDDTKIPDLSVVLGEVDCENETRSFSLTTDANNPSFIWEGPEGYASVDQNPVIGALGTYAVTVTSSNGCTVDGIIAVTESVTYTSEISVEGNQASISISGGTGPFVITWDNGQVGEMATDLTAGEHIVTVIDGLGCIKEFTFEIMPSNTVEFQTSFDISIYPNPAFDVIYVDITALSELPKRIEVINSQGEIVEVLSQKANWQNGRVTLNLTRLPSGIYFMRMLNETNKQTLKFIKAD